MEMKATAEYYPVIVEQESNGTWSAYVAELPGVFAAADSAAEAKRAIRGALAAHLGDATNAPSAGAQVKNAIAGPSSQLIPNHQNVTSVVKTTPLLLSRNRGRSLYGVSLMPVARSNHIGR